MVELARATWLLSDWPYDAKKLGVKKIPLPKSKVGVSNAHLWNVRSEAFCGLSLSDKEVSEEL